MADAQHLQFIQRFDPAERRDLVVFQIEILKIRQFQNRRDRRDPTVFQRQFAQSDEIFQIGQRRERHVFQRQRIDMARIRHGQILVRHLQFFPNRRLDHGISKPRRFCTPIIGINVDVRIRDALFQRLQRVDIAFVIRIANAQPPKRRTQKKRRIIRHARLRQIHAFQRRKAA